MSAVSDSCEPSAPFLTRHAPDLIRSFDLLTTAPGATAKLRALILSLAVHGKLVQQEPADSPAGVLLARIQAEANAKRTAFERASLLSARPFAIPNTWEWTALGEVVDLIRGITFPASEKTKQSAPNRIPCLRTTNVQHSIEWQDLLFVDRSFMGREEQLIRHHDIVMSMANSRELVGKVALIEGVPYPEATFGGFLGVLRPRHIDPRYVMAVLRTDYARSALIGSASQTTNIANISLGKLRPLPFPLPPLAEQHRIVARLEELMKLCDALEQSGRLVDEQHARLISKLFGALAASESAHALAENWQRVAEHFDVLLDRPESIDALNQIISQLAVRGWIVPQDARDGPASALRDQIRAEKQRFGKLGQRARTRSSRDRRDDQIPFELPKSWEWVSLDEIATQITDGAHHTPTYVASGVPFLSVKNLSSGRMCFSDTRFITPTAHSELSKRCRPQMGDLLLTKIGTTGIAVVIDDPRPFSIFVSVALIKLPRDLIDRRFLSLVINSPFVRKQSQDGTEGVGNKNLVLRKIAAFAIPLPPLAEQRRIVARVEELHRLCSDLRQRLTQARETQSRLADALVAEVT